MYSKCNFFVLSEWTNDLVLSFSFSSHLEINSLDVVLDPLSFNHDKPDILIEFRRAAEGQVYVFLILIDEHLFNFFGSCKLVFLESARSLSFFKHHVALFLFAIIGGHFKVGKAFLFTILPVPFVAASVRPFKNAETLLNLVDVLTDIRLFIRPIVLPYTVYFAIVPLSLVLSMVFPEVSTDAIELIIFKFSLVLRAIRPVADTLSSSLAILELTDIV
jgi:hypothetical protein